MLRIPRTRIAHRTPTRTDTYPTIFLGQAIRRYLLQQHLLMPRTQDINLGHRHLVQPRLDDRPHGRKRPRRIDDIKLPHRLGVSVLPDRGGLHHVVLDAVKVGERDAPQVEDRAGRLDGVPPCGGARGQPLREELFVFEYEPFKLALLRRDRVETLDVQQTQSLDVYRPAILFRV